MNSTNEQLSRLIEDVKTRFSCLGVDMPAVRQVAFDFESRDIHGVLSYLKSAGWRQLSLFTCIDWIEENKFQLVYIIANWENGIMIQVRTKIDRSNPAFQTVINIYPGAVYYERDVHEFFGVTFDGNPDSNKHLFLELWDEMPPMRKDFDPLEYSNRKYPDRKYKGDFSTEEGGPK